MQRQGAKVKDLTLSKQKIAKRQKGRCPACGESLFNEEELQIHHQHTRSEGGTNNYNNLSLVHLSCHQHIHAKAERKDSAACCQKYNDMEHLTALGRPKPKRRQKQEEEKEPCVRDVLKLCALRGACTVSRGGRRSNTLLLPDCVHQELSARAAGEAQQASETDASDGQWYDRPSLKYR